MNSPTLIVLIIDKHDHKKKIRKTKTGSILNCFDNILKNLSR